MANWSQSHFLQSLGWATLNSFWQMALLWCIYTAAIYLFPLSSRKKYQISVLAISLGFAWFVFTFTYYFQSSAASGIAFFDQGINGSNSILNILLLSASITYLSLLIFPSYKLVRNWQFVQKIKKQGLRKAELNFRLFVQKISGQLGIRHKVGVYISDLVRSPLTVGYLKPIILLPVAALSNLTAQQVEAILLHELSHIRRYDYLVNLMMSLFSTLLYFNPFVKLFMRNIEAERENCCDQLVLQFGYDKLGYASALLTLEKLSINHRLLAMGATGKKNLLNRIEKIVGLEKKKGFSLNHFAGIVAALFCILVFNSVLIIKDKVKENSLTAYDSIANPLNLFSTDDASRTYSITPANHKGELWVASTTSKTNNENPVTHTVPVTESQVMVEAPVQPEPSSFINVDYNEVESSLTKEEKAKVKSTVEATRKILSSLQWKEVEKSIAEVMSEQEKVKAKEEYIRELEKTVNWQGIEQNMKAKYQELDWSRINNNVKKGLTEIRLDSLENSYIAIINQLNLAKEAASVNARVSVSPCPDQSIDDLMRSTEDLRKRVDTIRVIRNPKKVVRL